MRIINTEWLHPSVQSSLNRNNRRRVRPVGLNPEQALELQLISEQNDWFKKRK